jgi:transcriptional regulator with XRE-family HTH domain
MSGETHVMRRRELAGFLRTRRERLAAPQAAQGQRRRTPGLRREEVAEKAGVGLSWYTWLEQGRDIRVSPEVLRRIARALQLNATELRHIFQLAGLELPVTAPPVITAVRPSLQRLLDSMEYTPAYIHNARWDRIAWNQAALALMGDFSRDPEEERNTLWRTFVKEEVKGYTEDWELLARELIGEFNASVSQQLDDPWLEDFTERLAARSAEFRQWRLEREVKTRDSWPTRIRHRSAGLLHLERSVFCVPHAESLSMVVFVPLDIEGSPARLRKAIDQFRQATAS